MTMSKDLKKYIDQNIVLWTDETVGEECRQHARNSGLPFYIVDRIETKKVGKMHAKVVNDYKITSSSDRRKRIPLGHLLNNGWGEGGYDIHGKPILSWLDSHGNRRFATKVRHPGFIGYHFMEFGKTAGIRKFNALIELQVRVFENWMVTT